MTERERLIELLKKGRAEHSERSLAEIRKLLYEKHRYNSATDKVGNLWDELADYLLANGVILVDTEEFNLVTNRGLIKTAFGMPLDELADLIRAKQRGRIIELPCNVGDYVEWDNGFGAKTLHRVKGFLYNPSDLGLRFMIGDCTPIVNNLSITRIVPKEEAEVVPIQIVETTADVAEVKHGEWREHFAFGCWHYDCPFCEDGYAMKEKDNTPPNYCQNCGAKMDGKKVE